MRKLLFAALFSLLSTGAALAQATCPTFYYGLVLTAAQWQACFDSKQNVIGYTPVNRAGDTMTGELVLAASTTSHPGINVAPGNAPTSPSNGDFWVTASGAFIQVGGVTVGPLGGGSSASFAGTSPITVSFPSGVVTYAFDFTVANSFLASQTFRTLLAGTTNTYDIGVSAAASAFRTIYAGTSFVGPIGTFTTSVAIGGATIGGNALAVTGTSLFNSGVTMSAALTYGGVTLTNAVSGTGPMLLGASPTITGHATIEGVTATGATGSGAFVFGTAPSVSALTVTGSFTATGLVTNADLANASTTVNSQTCTLGSSCTITAAATSISIGTTTVLSGTTTRILYNNAGVAGEYTISGSGTSVAMATGPTITGSTLTSIATLALRDTSAAFDVTIAATSSAALTAGRTLTLNMGNVAHTLSFGTTASTGSGIIFPNTATDTVGMLGVANAWTGNQTHSGTELFTGALYTFGSNGQASIGASATAGGVVGGKGSSKDLTLANSAGTSVCDVATGTTTLNCTTLTLTNKLTSASIVAGTNAALGVVQGDGSTITCIAGTCTALGAAATSIAVGTTTITSGTSGTVFYDNGGVLGKLTPTGNIAVSGSTLVVTKPANCSLTLVTGASQNSSTSFPASDNTGVKCSLTPSSSSSKVLVTASMCTAADGTASFAATLARNTSTNLATGTPAAFYSVPAGSSSLYCTMATMTFLDSPATTSSTTYGVQMWRPTGSGATFINRDSPTGTVYGIATIYAEEVLQ